MAYPNFVTKAQKGQKSLKSNENAASRLVSVFINASRRCRKLNENSLSLSEFKTKGIADAL